MSTTTIRLPDDLKARIARVVEETGTTAHSFILEAIAEKAESAEQRAALHALADQRYADFLDTGQSVPWEDARVYLREQMAGRRVKRPSAHKPAR